MKKIGLALGSGGWRGGAHIGVIRTLEKHGIPIDFIAGTSVGAIVGGLYAYKKEIDKVEDIFKQFKGINFAKTFLDISGEGGLLKGKRFIKYLNEYLNGAEIKDTQIPFCATATDMLSGESVVITEGSLAETLQISSTIPVLFKPTLSKGKYLVDGAITVPIPVQIVKNMGADIVIAVDTLKAIFPIDKRIIGKITGTKTAHIALRILLESLSKRDVVNADFIINPKIPGAETGFMLKALINKNISKYGEEATEKIIPDIKKLLSK